MKIQITDLHLAMTPDVDGIAGPLPQALYEATGDRWFVDGGRAYRLDPLGDEPADREGVPIPGHAQFLGDPDTFCPQAPAWVQPFAFEFDFPLAPVGAAP